MKPSSDDVQQRARSKGRVAKARQLADIVSALRLQALLRISGCQQVVGQRAIFVGVPLGQALLVLASVSCEAGESNQEPQRGARERAERSSCAHTPRCE